MSFKKSSLTGLLLGLFGLVALTGYSLRLGGTEPAASSHPASQDGAEIYMTRCMSCHQMNGRGVPGVFPPLTESKWVTEDKGVVIRIVLNGMTGEVKVGDEVYSGAMPPWQTFLDDKQVSELLTYIRSTWGNEAPAISAEEVAKVRKAVEDRKEPWTAEELSKEENQGIPGETAKDASGG